VRAARDNQEDPRRVETRHQNRARHVLTTRAEWERTAIMGTKLYVSKLAFNATEDDLEEAFVAMGLTVESARIITNRTTGESLFGVVEMMTELDAERAIRRLKRIGLRGYRRRVNEAREAKKLNA
jgi:RNA recognition motif-containing protein